MVFVSRILLKAQKTTAKTKSLFIDNLRVYTKGGTGGNGKSGLGGVGGRGGHVYVVCKQSCTLKDVINKNPEKRFIAGHGEHSKRTAILGQPGTDLEIEVPPGITVRTDAGETLGEVNALGERVLVTKGGAGGEKHNQYVGEKGQTQSVRLDLKLIADIGLVGFPNAGKSTLLSSTSRAAPKIAAYPFTTIKPQLGVMHYPDHRKISMADLPGLIEGAHVNVGMGHNFLKHVERTKLLLFVVDIHGFRLGVNHEQRSVFETIILLNKELELYKPELMNKPAVLALNKIDIEGSEEKIDNVQEQLKNMKESVKQLEPKLQPRKLVKFDDVFCISAKKKLGTEELKDRLRNLLDLYSDIESNSEERLNRAMAKFEDRNREKFHTYLV